MKFINKCLILLITVIIMIIMNILHLIRLSHICVCMCIYRVSQEEWTKLRESVPYVELY